MRYRNNILVLDTETVMNFKYSTIYDIGYAILDEKLDIITTREYLVQEVYNNAYLMDTAYYKEKMKGYNARLESGELTLKPFREILDEMLRLMSKHKIKVYSAYNLAFDERAIMNTLRLVASDKVSKWVNKKDKLKTLCIWDLACDTILQEQDFKTVAEANEWVSSKGNILTNAEVAYRYLTDNPDFVEDHTSLSDVLIEVKILREILQTYQGNLSYGLKYHAWKKVNKKEKE